MPYESRKPNHRDEPTVKAKKSFGQNFLVDERVVDRIVTALAPRPDETIIEIGAGRGALTSRLVEKAGRLIAIEFDRDLVPPLREHFDSRSNFQLIESDALLLDYCAVVSPASNARVVANLPYYISTAILQRLITYRACLTEMVLMLQREVVDRLSARPGSSDRGYLSVLVEASCDIDVLFDVAPGSFRPRPKVWSTVVRLAPKPALDTNDEQLLWQLVSAGFAHKRKTIFNNLRNAPSPLPAFFEAAGGVRHVLDGSGLDPGRRAETLTIDEWRRLSNAVTVFVGPTRLSSPGTTVLS
jgi:16S rRNA (adenine1518-N6/adenine1519-N6)-dimethyltransferase